MVKGGMGGWMDGWREGKMEGGIDGWRGGWMCGWMDRGREGWGRSRGMDGWIVGGMDGGVGGSRMPFPPSGCLGMSMGCEPVPLSQEAESPVGPGGRSPNLPSLFFFSRR